MGILRIILIIRLDIAALLAEFRQQVCTTNINLSTVPVAVIHVHNNLLIAIPDMIDCLAVDCLTRPQSICVIFITRCCLSIGKSDQLIQTVISVCLCLTLCGLCDLISVGIIGICSFFCLCICSSTCDQVCRTNC